MPFIPVVLSVLLSAVLPASPPPAVHVVIETERAYMGSVQKVQIEHWLGADRSWVSQRGRVIVTRRDLGVRWLLNPARKTYIEEKLAATASQAAPAGEDIHTARFDYEPVFDWTVTQVGRTTVAGRQCREYAAQGQADFAQTSIRFAIGPHIDIRTDQDVNVLLAGLARLESVSRFLRETARNRGNGSLMSYEETQEPAIAPTIVQRVKISTLEIAAAPAGQFDVPDGYTKASR